MQALENKPRRISISLPEDARKGLASLREEGVTYWQILKPMITSANEARTGSSHGIIFLTTVYINSNLKNLKQPLPLKVHIAKNGMIHLSNTDYKILVSSPSLQEAMEDARIEYDDMCSLFNNPDIPKSRTAIEFGRKLINEVME